jgi:O-antigen ligase
LLFTLPWLELAPAQSRIIPGLNLVTINYIACWLLSLRERKIEYSNCPFTFAILFQFLVVFGSWILVSTIGEPPVGYDVVDNLYVIKRRFLYLILFFITLNLSQSEEEIKKNLQIIFASVFLIGVQVFRQYLEIGTTKRLGDVLGYNNGGTFFSLYYAIPLLFLLARKQIFENWNSRILTFGIPIIALIFSIWALILSQSRGAWLGFAASVGVLALLRSKKILVALSLLLLLAIQTSVLDRILPAVVVERIEYTTSGARDGNKFEGSAQGRLFMYQAGIRMFVESPILGKGTGTFPYHLPYYSNYRIPTRRSPHSEWIRALAENGIVGLAAFGFIFFVAFAQGFKLLRSSRDFPENALARNLAICFIACTVSLAINSTFGVRFFNATINGYFWIIAANTYIYIRIFERTHVQTANINSLEPHDEYQSVTCAN